MLQRGTRKAGRMASRGFNSDRVPNEFSDTEQNSNRPDMKTLRLPSLFVAAFFAAALAFTGSASAQTNAYDDAYHYSHASATWPLIYQGTNSGFGFNAWMLATNGPGSHAFFTSQHPPTAPVP